METNATADKFIEGIASTNSAKNPLKRKLITYKELFKEENGSRAEQLLEAATFFIDNFDEIEEEKIENLLKLLEKNKPKITKLPSYSVPNAAVKLIQEFEGLADIKSDPPMVKAYADPKSGGEPYTIGWGTTVYPDGKKVKKGDRITREEADQYFAENLKKSYWNKLQTTIPRWDEMNDEMRSALCSFAYNLGAGFYGTHGFNTITTCLRDQKWDAIPQALMLYVNPGSSVEAGLRRRRGAEGELWLKGLAKKRNDKGVETVRKIIRAKQYTFLKKENKQASDLEENQLVTVVAGRYYEVEEHLAAQGDSQQVRLAHNAGTWWIYEPHWDFGTKEKDENVLVDRSFDSKKNIIAGFPYLSQNDNLIDPYKTCNVTCVAMCLRFFGVKGDGSGQLEDQLMRKISQQGWNRGDPYHLKQLIDSYPNVNLTDEFTEQGTFAKIKQSIQQDRPVIIHGYFTPKGHIIVIKGYDDTGFIVNDPHGEYFKWGYDRSKSGEELHYSYNLIAKVCSPESESSPRNIWLHSIYQE